MSMALGPVGSRGVARWGLAQLCPEHRAEGAGRRVTHTVGHVGHRMPGAEQAQGLKETELAPPAGNRHPGVAHEQPLEGPATGSDALGELSHARHRTLGQLLSKRSRSGIAGLGELQRRQGQLVELVDDHLDQAAVARVAPIQWPAPDGLDDQLAQQR